MVYRIVYIVSRVVNKNRKKKLRNNFDVENK